MTSNGELLIPVGHDLGVLYPDSESNQHRQQVRLGVEVMELEDEDFAVWLLAHGTDGDDRPTAESLAAQGENLGLHGVRSAIERFRADGLLVAVDPAADEAVEFAREHQLFPLLHGLGPDPEEPWLQSIGLMNQPLVQASTALYDVWAWAQLAPELWTGCQDAAAVAQQVGVTNPEEIEPRQVLTGVLAQIHGLLSVRAAYFDRRRIR
ncbi:hypothetical protein [Kribbella sindirgiensis]|uniref:Uncharacterized protein n=1 Tax=Kribbella sindirgiensis TaxID=1124744 RepID=A0A4R0IDP6_9ACTN|nr:hypothetical protein [Kribbella sindirgiensis]TCC22339.1 hypothetical protein E0H50_34750 [Kribbella sindirgiensis]